ncbi:MAG: FAD-binding oxidoreductase, partial [Pseudomonadota bacterium]
ATHGLTRRWATRQLRRMFPQLGPVAFETGWHGHIAMTSDHLPRIHVLAEGLYAATAYNGRGITTGTLFGQAIAALLSGSPPSALPLPLSPVRPARGGRALSLAYDLAFTFNQARRSI